MKILVTGSTGMLGTAVVSELRDRGYGIRAMVEPGCDSGTLQDQGVEIVAADVLDPDAVLAVAEGCEGIVHSAAVVSYWPRRSVRTESVNFRGTINVINAAIRAGVRRMVYVGSASSFGAGSLRAPGDERAPYRAGKYGASYFDSKLAAQQTVLDACHSVALPAVIVNPTFMIGPYGNDRGSASLVLRLGQGRMPFVPPGGRNFVCSRDVAVAIVNALDRGRLGECYIIGGENLSYASAFRRICSVLGAKTPSRRISPVVLRTLGNAQSALAAVTGRPPLVSSTLAWMLCDECYYSSKKAHIELSLPATAIETAVEESWAWYLERGIVADSSRAAPQSNETLGDYLAIGKGEEA